MTELTLEALAKRIEALEKKLAAQEAGTRDWRSVVGMFDGDPEFMQKVFAEIEANSEAERRAAMEENPE
jgi:hypothetical protein